jgi:curved DNA-binding protein CbpA
MAGSLDEDKLRALPLAAVDRFVLSLVDGKTSARGLADVVGIETEQVLASLLKLESMHLVVLPSSRAAADRPAPKAASVPPVAASDELDLEPEHRRQIDELSAGLATLDHYAFLGVARSADRKTIKRAYFERTSKFHPDRFFRKRLGPYKLKMESVFGRMTEAHDTLTSADRRADYDAYLGSVEKSRSIEQMLAEAMSEVKRAEDAVSEVSVAISSIPPPPGSSPAPANVREPPPQGEPTPASVRAFDPPSSPNLGAFISDTFDARISKKPGVGRISVIPSSEPPHARRELLARRLTGNVRAPTPAKVPTIAFAKTEDAVDALKRRYQEKVTLARTSQVRKYRQAATEAREKGDIVAAANALRVALEFDPENVELQSSHQEAQTAADTLLVDQYLKQAEYEEKAEKWAEAGRSWTRVARTRTTDARAHERAAYCTLKANGNLHEAGSMGQRAVQLEPKNAAYRRTLANVYLAAGLTLNAKRELETAVQLAPDDAQTAAVLKRIAKSS